MKSYKVSIIEVLQKDVEIEAPSRAEAELQAEREWKNGDHILDSDHFRSVNFKAELRQRERDYER